MKEVLKFGTLRGPGQAAGVGKMWFIAAGNQFTDINLTFPPGGGTGSYLSVLGWMGDQGWNIKKIDESIEISPTHAQYYQMVIGQKQQLEGQIKQGLGSAADAVADYELLSHDLRKLEKFMNHFEAIEKGSKKDATKKEKDAKKKAEHALKAIFIDQIDIHDQTSSMVQRLAPRWPTIIADFQDLEDEDLDAKEIMKELNIGRPQAEILETKQRIYLDWKNTFKDAVKKRYERIKGQVESREESIKQYKNWLKPYVARHKMINETYEDPSAAAENSQSWYNTQGRSLGNHSISLWCYQPVYAAEPHVPSREVRDKEFIVEPFDDVVKAMCFGGEVGDLDYKGPDNPEGEDKSLMEHYQWLTKDMIKDWVKEIKKKSISSSEADSLNATAGPSPLDPYTLYYNFLTITFSRSFEATQGVEYESVDWSLQNAVASQNAMMMKLLELKAAEKDFEIQINKILGVQNEEGQEMSSLMKKDYPTLFGADNKSDKDKKDKSPGKIKQTKDDISNKISSAGKKFNSLLKTFGLDKVGLFYGKGKYDPRFKDIITSGYMRQIAGNYFPVIGQIKSSGGVP